MKGWSLCASIICYDLIKEIIKLVSFFSLALLLYLLVSAYYCFVIKVPNGLFWGRLASLLPNSPGRQVANGTHYYWKWGDTEREASLKKKPNSRVWGGVLLSRSLQQCFKFVWKWSIFSYFWGCVELSLCWTWCLAQDINILFLKACN